MDEIIHFDDLLGRALKIKKITVSTNAPIELYQIYDESDRRWRLIKYDNLIEFYKLSVVQKRNVLIEKTEYDRKEKEKS